MSVLGRNCPQCGSEDIVEDEHYSESQLVCADCGAVVSDGLLTTTKSEETQGTDVRYRNIAEQYKQPCRNQIKGIHRVRALGRILRLTFLMEETAEGYFRKAYEHPKFINVSLQKKEVLAGCCILATCRQHNWPITMGTLTCLLEANPNIIGKLYREMVTTLKIDAPPTSVIDLLEMHCQSYKLSHQDIPEELSENSTDLRKRASVLLEIAVDAWLVTGRQPIPVLIASVYLAWQSLKPTQTRLKFTLARFCHMAKVPKSSIAPKRVKEFKEILCKLGQELPWLRGAEVTLHNVVKMVDDIVKYRLTLMQNALRSYEASLALEPELPLSAEDCKTQTEKPTPDDAALSEPNKERTQQQGDVDPTYNAAMEGLSSPASEKPTADYAALSEPNKERTQRQGDVDPTYNAAMEQLSSPAPEKPTADDAALSEPNKERTRRQGDVDPTYNAVMERLSSPAPDRDSKLSQSSALSRGKRNLFEPPSVTHYKIRRVQLPMKEVTGDEEISDNEIDSYIRTAQEMRDYANAQEELASSDEDSV